MARDRGGPAPAERIPLGERLHDPFFWALAKKRVGYFLGALGFLATFGAVGFFASYLVFTTVRDGLRAPGWPQVPARVQSVGESGAATYTYEYRGAHYTGERVGTFRLGGSSDDERDRRREAKLEAALASGTPVVAFVNPDDPRDAMLDTEIPWKLLMFCVPFALAFGAVGLGGFLFMLVKALGLDAVSTQPMLKPRSREMLAQWSIGILWTAAAMPIAFLFIPEMWAQGRWFSALLVAVFPLIGVLILWGALVTTGRVIRAGNPFNPAFIDDFSRR